MGESFADAPEQGQQATKVQLANAQTFLDSILGPTPQTRSSILDIDKSQRPTNSKLDLSLPDIPNQSVADQLNVLQVGELIKKKQQPFFDLIKSSPETFIQTYVHGYRSYDPQKFGYKVHNTLATDTKEVADGKELLRYIRNEYPNGDRYRALKTLPPITGQIEDYRNWLSAGVVNYDETLQLMGASQKLEAIDKNKDGVIKREELAEASQDTKKQFSARELQVLNAKFDQLKPTSTTDGGKVDGISKESVENFVAEGLFQTSTTRIADTIRREGNNQTWGFARRFDYYSKGWDMDRNGHISKFELNEVTKRTSGQEQLIAKIALRNFGTLERASKPVDPLSRLLAQGGITNGPVELRDIYFGNPFPFVVDYVGKSGYQAFMLDLLRNKMLP